MKLLKDLNVGTVLLYNDSQYTNQKAVIVKQGNYENSPHPRTEIVWQDNLEIESIGGNAEVKENSLWSLPQ